MRNVQEQVVLNINVALRNEVAHLFPSQRGDSVWGQIYKQIRTPVRQQILDEIRMQIGPVILRFET